MVRAIFSRIMNQKETNNCVRNAHGIWINKGCMSCRFRIYIQGKRLCGVTNKRKASTDICDRWELSDGLKNAGLGSGKVKHRVTKEVILR